MAREPVTLQFGEQSFEVVREALVAGEMQVTLPAGGTYSVRAIGNGEYRLAQAGNDRTTAALCAQDGKRRWVFLDGEVFVIEVREKGDERRRPAAGSHGLTAPMPATVTKVFVSVGQTVKRGETLLVLEAMKMEMPVKAPVDGVVKKINCQPNQLVQPDVQLIELE